MKNERSTGGVRPGSIRTRISWSGWRLHTGLLLDPTLVASWGELPPASGSWQELADAVTDRGSTAGYWAILVPEVRLDASTPSPGGLPGSAVTPSIPLSGRSPDPYLHPILERPPRVRGVGVRNTDGAITRLRDAIGPPDSWRLALEVLRGMDSGSGAGCDGEGGGA